MSVLLMLLMMVVFFGVYEIQNRRKTRPKLIHKFFAHPGSNLGLTMADGGQPKEAKK